MIIPLELNPGVKFDFDPDAARPLGQYGNDCCAYAPRENGFEDYEVHVEYDIDHVVEHETEMSEDRFDHVNGHSTRDWTERGSGKWIDLNQDGYSVCELYELPIVAVHMYNPEGDEIAAWKSKEVCNG